MNRTGYLAFGLCLMLLVFLLLKTVKLSSELETANEKNDRTAADLLASVKRAEAELVGLKETASGLGSPKFVSGYYATIRVRFVYYAKSIEVIGVHVFSYRI